MARERLVPKMTQQQLADHFKISDKAVSAWERDETTPEYDKLPKLRHVLRVSFAWLLAGSGPPPSPDDTTVKFDDWTIGSFQARESDTQIELTNARK